MLFFLLVRSHSCLSSRRLLENHGMICTAGLKGLLHTMSLGTSSRVRKRPQGGVNFSTIILWLEVGFSLIFFDV